MHARVIYATLNILCLVLYFDSRRISKVLGRSEGAECTEWGVYVLTNISAGQLFKDAVGCLYYRISTHLAACRFKLGITRVPGYPGVYRGGIPACRQREVID